MINNNNIVFFNLVIILTIIIWSSITSKSYSINIDDEKSYNINKISIDDENIFSSLSRSLVTEDEVDEEGIRRDKL